MLTNEKFGKMTEDELKKGFELCRESVENHFTVAEYAAEKEIFSIAVSHLVLGAEESIKALIIAAKIYNPNIKLDEYGVDISEIFKEHRPKREEAKKVLPEAINLVLKFLYDGYEYYNSDKATEIKNKESLLKEISEQINSVKQLQNLDYKTFWNQEANKWKNRGFYVNYYEDKWKSPNEIDKNLYKEFYTKLEIYLNAVNINNINLNFKQ